ncbi:hypothetical protein DUNSADRAFT_4319 [Dunaliella salina]|uniref:Uncharacterized protein n=1 Tax=Dunaliella salina TaxID=3046 RepID=A0ABQ7H7M7_DUNSA|nr:hypothetical protein DUNSADRAFT_4319 [Dunaliella salina]|eukprot:KAF5842860.1 hypothetical protein DUNSADRAFT_4319 [Dunaliella salina]
MGWITQILGQVCLTSLILGGMKRQGIIVLKPEAVDNQTLRSALVRAVSLGEDVADKLEKITRNVVDTLQEKK